LTARLSNQAERDVRLVKVQMRNLRRTRRTHPAIHRPALAPARNRAPVTTAGTPPTPLLSKSRPRATSGTNLPAPEASSASGMPSLRLNSYE